MPDTTRIQLPLLGILSLLLPLLTASGRAHAADADMATSSSLRPARVFVQLGGNQGAATATAGASWDLGWQHDSRWGPIDAQLELSAGRWRSDRDMERNNWTSQFGMTPVLRLRPLGWALGWRVEAGIGLNLLTPVYQRENKHFSTRYNFGDHIGLAYQWGGHEAHELGLRLQHYSNAGLKKPNPGENFLQLRYAYRL